MRHPRLALAAGIGYALGVVPFADLAARHASDGRIDLRDWGSGNPGAMNAIRTLGTRYGIAVAVADAGKGAVACLAGRYVAGDVGGHVAGVSAVAGHCYPATNGFRGGKGIATSSGQLLATLPLLAPIEAAVGVGTGALVRPGRPGRWALLTTIVACATWIGGSVVWCRRSLPTGSGVAPTAGVPIAAAASSLLIMSRFWRTIRDGLPDDYGPDA